MSERSQRPRIVKIRLRTTFKCRNIKTLFNFDPPVTDEEVRAASLQFVRKITGFNKPSKANEASFLAPSRKSLASRLAYSVRSKPMRLRRIAKKRPQKRKLVPPKDSGLEYRSVAFVGIPCLENRAMIEKSKAPPCRKGRGEMGHPLHRCASRQVSHASGPRRSIVSVFYFFMGCQTAAIQPSGKTNER